MRFGPAYYNAGKLQEALFERVCDRTSPAREIAQCARSWIELERLKREMRGIPPLAAAKVTETLARMKRSKPMLSLEPVEIDAEPTQ
jgi:hypothetical protein